MRSLFITILFCVIYTLSCSDSTGPDLSADVAIYDDPDAWSHSVTALENLAAWMGLTVERIDADYVSMNSLDGFRIFVVPGGNMHEYARHLTLSGIRKIRDFVEEGGGYIGICGGGYFACGRIVWNGSQLSMNSLDFFECTAQGTNNAIAAYPGYGMCDITVSDTEHPVIRNLNQSLRILYYWGPCFHSFENTDQDILGLYSAVNQAAIMAKEYGEGRIFVIGTHPEIEEDSDRDGVTWGDEMLDGESDWPLLENAVNWCLKQNETNVVK